MRRAVAMGHPNRWSPSAAHGGAGQVTITEANTLAVADRKELPWPVDS